jgi:hypothetical protein
VIDDGVVRVLKDGGRKEEYVLWMDETAGMVID